MNPTTPIDAETASLREYMNLKLSNINKKYACLYIWKAYNHGSFGGIIIFFCHYMFAFEDWRQSYNQMVASVHGINKPITGRICKKATLIINIFKKVITKLNILQNFEFHYQSIQKFSCWWISILISWDIRFETTEF